MKHYVRWNYRKHIENCDTLYGIVITDGIGARGEQDIQVIRILAQASIRTENILGLTWLEGGSFPDYAMDSVPLLAVTKIIEEAKSLVKPTLVYTHSSVDLNIDHRVVSQATLTAFRP